MIHHLMTIPGTLAAFGALGLGPDPAPQSQTDRLTANLEQVAADVSILLTQDKFRALLTSRIKESPRKNVLVLSEFLGGALAGGLEDGSGSLLALAGLVQRAEAQMGKCDLAIPRLEIKLPVRAHRDLLGNSNTVYVAAAPLAEESEVKSITAFSKGERITLDAHEPPTLPTLVVLPAETLSEEPTYPLMISAEPEPEKNPARVVDDYVGIPWIKITNDHESWVCGDPEIYVRILRWQLPSCKLINQTVGLPGVNDENVWYYLHDSNSTYKYVSNSYVHVIRFEVWEADSGAHGADDHVGTVNVTWTNLPFGGYTYFSNKDVRMDVDRD